MNIGKKENIMSKEHEQGNSNKIKPDNFRCNACGKYISLFDLESGIARYNIVPDNHFSGEDCETLCIKCNKK